MARIIFLILFSLASSASAQEYLYPNKFLSDRGLLEYRPYSLEEAKAYEAGGFSWEPPFLTGWGPERRLTDQENVYWARAISSGETLYCAYAIVLGNEAYFIRSTDEGDTWEPEISFRDTTRVLFYFWPEVLRGPSGLIMGAATQYQGHGNNLTYYVSSDDGVSWGPQRQVFANHNSDISHFGAFANSNATVYGSYINYARDSLYMIKSTDWGTTWNGRGVNVAYLNSTLQNMTLRASGGVLHLVWVNEEGTISVRYSRSTDGGLTWSPEIDIAQDPQGAQWCYVAAEDSHVVASWMGYRYSSYGFTGDYFVRQSFDHGATWDSAQVLTDLHYVRRGTVHIADTLVAAVWQDQRYADTLSNSEIFCRMSTDHGRSWAAEERVSFGYRDSFAPVTTSTDDVIHVLWGDYRNEGPGLYYRANDPLTGIEEWHDDRLPGNMGILSCYPNPFNSYVKIDYSISRGKKGEIAIYNVLGQRVKTFVIHGKEGSVVWDARDSNGSSLASGIYFAKMSASGNDITRKLLYLK